jgi:hypothetical protein
MAFLMDPELRPLWQWSGHGAAVRVLRGQCRWELAAML